MQLSVYTEIWQIYISHTYRNIEIYIISINSTISKIGKYILIVIIVIIVIYLISPLQLLYIVIYK